MNIKRRCALLLAVILLLGVLLPAAGCLDGKSVEDFEYVLAIGIDSGEKLKYKVTFLMQGASQSGEASQPGKLVLVSAEGPDMMTALRTAEMGAPEQFSFSRMNLIAVARDVASAGLLEEIFSFSITELQIRLSSGMIVTTNKCSEFFRGLEYADDLNYSKLVESLIGYRRDMGVTTSQSLSQFFTTVRTYREDAVLSLGSTDNSVISSERGEEAEKKGEKPAADEEDTTGGIEREGGMKSYVEGAAIFSGYTMVGVLSVAEVQLLTLAKGDLNGSLMSFSKESGYYSVRMENSRDTEVRVTLTPTPRVVYSIYLSGRLEQDTDIEELLKKRGSTDIMDDTAHNVTEYIQDGLYKLFYHCQELNSDAFALGRYAAAKFSSVKDWEEYDFKSHFPEFEVEFNVKLDLEDVFIASYRE